MGFFVIGIFITFNILTMYILFEATLLSMFIYIGIFGSRSRKTLAYFLLFLYTLVTALPALLAILFLILYVGSYDIFKNNLTLCFLNFRFLNLNNFNCVVGKL